MGFARSLALTLIQRAQQLPVVVVTGPRQAGKTTLCRDAFPALPYLNLERPDLRQQALADPQAFLARLAGGGIVDEVQRVPELLSWVQVTVDERERSATSRVAPLILTGSHSFELMHSVTQSLAGRVALLNLLPLSLAELRAAGQPTSTTRLLHAGGYPRIHADGLDPAVALGDYFATYVERDLRELIELRQLDTFRRFVRVAAGRVGQILNLQSLANDVGVSGPTAKAWVGLLEASFIVKLLPPWFANIGKRLIKSPKLYFCDTGLAAWLMGITQESQIDTHPLRGLLFENLVVMEFYKHALHHGQVPQLHFYRDSSGTEVDLVVEHGVPPGQVGLVEIKAGMTFFPEQVKTLHRVAALLGARVARRMLVTGGSERFGFADVEIEGIQAAA